MPVSAEAALHPPRGVAGVLGVTGWAGCSPAPIAPWHGEWAEHRPWRVGAVPGKPSERPRVSRAEHRVRAQHSPGRLCQREIPKDWKVLEKAEISELPRAHSVQEPGRGMTGAIGDVPAAPRAVASSRLPQRWGHQGAASTTQAEAVPILLIALLPRTTIYRTCKTSKYSIFNYSIHK